MNSLDLPECYANMLRWTRQNGIIKAVPKKKLSYVAHDVILKAFKRCGGAYVSSNGDHYFELVTKPVAMSDSAVSRAYRELESKGVFEEV